MTYRNFDIDGNKITVAPGACIDDVLSEIIAWIKAEGNKKIYSFDFNDVDVRVKHDSDVELILRDWRRAMPGYISKKVGPYPSKVLTQAELDSDAELGRKRQEEIELEKAKYAAKVELDGDALNVKIAVAPGLELIDTDFWNKAEAAQTDAYGKRTIQYAADWARLMQAEIAAGKTIKQVYKKTSEVADYDGISGFMYGMAKSLLQKCWKYGAELPGGQFD